MNKTYNPLHILCCNGWKWHMYNTDPIIQMDDPNDEYYVYTNTFLGKSYSTTVLAAVSAHSAHLCLDGHYGVLWLSAVEYENKPPHSIDDLEDMISAIVIAEEHLLKIGMPFSPLYQFHGSNKANNKRRNEKLRRLYNLDELERKEEE